jgi:hypothetical protein
MGETLSKIYASHVGAADRMAADALAAASRDGAPSGVS